MIDPADTARTLLAEKSSEWLAVVARRRSQRSYLPEPVDADVLDELEGCIERWRPHDDVRVMLVRDPVVDVFTGIVGSYGKVVGAPHVLVFAGVTDAPFVYQHVGYAAEAVVLEATRLGLSTCWVSGSFSARKVTELVSLRGDERVFAVSPVGIGVRSARPQLAARRRRVDQLAPGVAHGDWPQWAVAAVETARLAPSAYNRQPWRFRFEDGGLVVWHSPGLNIAAASRPLDIGIAMLHVEIAAAAHSVRGRWTDLAGRDVARFDPER